MYKVNIPKYFLCEYTVTIKIRHNFRKKELELPKTIVVKVVFIIQCFQKKTIKKEIDYQKSKQVLNFPMHRHRMSIFKQTFPLIMWYLAIN